MITKKASLATGYTIPMVDLSIKPSGADSKYDALYKFVVIDDATNYMAHPDAVLLKSGEIMAMYPEGHGRGNVVVKRSKDGGRTWSERLSGMPKSWSESKETPTVYRLFFQDGSEKVVMISGCPTWGNPFAGNGFNASFSEDDGETWSEFENYYGKGSNGFIKPMVAMASLTRLKDASGKFMDKWMGLCHDAAFHNYKTMLTFENGKMCWSKPERYFAKYRKVEKAVAMCEVEIIRNDNGAGDELCLIARSNGYNRNKPHNSIISFSSDEGVTWCEPRELPSSLNGERHKADYLSDGRLFITFRSIDRDPKKYEISNEKNGKGGGKWFSEGWVAWVGTYDDLKNGKEGQYRIKLAHTYLSPTQTEPTLSANGDTGYCGNVAMDNDMMFTSTYGAFGGNYKNDKGEDKLRTYIVGKTLDMKLVDELASKLK